MSVLTLWRYSRLPLRCLSFVLHVCRRRLISLEMDILDTLKWSAKAWWVIPVWTHQSFMVILTVPWHRRSCENSNFQNGKLFAFVGSTTNDRRWLNCLIRSLQTRSWDGKFTFRNISVTEQDIIVCIVRINAFHANIDVSDYKQFVWF